MRGREAVGRKRVAVEGVTMVVERVREAG